VLKVKNRKAEIPKGKEPEIELLIPVGMENKGESAVIFTTFTPD
jgi:hypothetical protein